MEGCHAMPSRGAMPHWRPVSVVLLTPVGSVRVIAGDDKIPSCVMVSDATS